MTGGSNVNFVMREALFEIYTWILGLSYLHEKQTSILKQKSLATQNLVGILFIMKIPVLKMDSKLIVQVCLHVNYPIIVMPD